MVVLELELEMLGLPGSGTVAHPNLAQQELVAPALGDALHGFPLFRGPLAALGGHPKYARSREAQGQRALSPRAATCYEMALHGADWPRTGPLAP